MTEIRQRRLGIIDTPDVRSRALRCEVADLTLQVAAQNAKIESLREELGAAKRKVVEVKDCAERSMRAAVAQVQMVAEANIKEQLTLACTREDDRVSALQVLSLRREVRRCRWKY
jgi:hypothetical protein